MINREPSLTVGLLTTLGGDCGQQKRARRAVPFLNRESYFC